MISIEERGYQFALRIYKLQRDLRQRQCEPSLCTQLLRAGTSVGANLAEAEVAYSKAELASKMSISLKELKEVEFWLRLLSDTHQISIDEYDQIKTDARELAKILFVSIRNLR